MRLRSYLEWLVLGLALSACEGGQTGTPSSGRGPFDYDAGCPRSVANADAATAFGLPPSALLDAFVGTHEISAYWNEATLNEPGVPNQFNARFYDDPIPENAVALTIEIMPAADFRLPPPRCENRLSAPVDVWLHTADGVLDTRFSALLLGEPSQVRIEIDADERATVTGTIELGEQERVDLMPLGDPARQLVAPWPCGHEQLPLDDAGWSIPPSQILSALNGRTDDVQFDPAGHARVRMDLTPVRMTACREDPSPVTGDMPVQLTLTDVDRSQPLISWVGQFVFGLRCEGEPYEPTSAPACSEFELVARGAPAITTWRLWPEPPVEPRRLAQGVVALRGTLRVNGSLSARASLGFFYNGGTPEGAYTGAAWSFDEP